MDVRQLSSCFFGMQHMHCKHKAVKLLLRMLISIVASKRVTFDAGAVSNIMYGLNIRTESPEVLILLKVLTPKIAACEVALNNTELSRSFFGIRGMDSDYE